MILTLIAGVCVAFNFIILKWKLEHERYLDFALDMCVMIVMSYLFLGTLTGMAIAMAGSMIFSLYLLVFPPKWE